MAQFKAMSPKVEVNGAAVLSVVEGMRFSRNLSLQILAGHGIVGPQVGRWYKQQDWLDSFKEIAERAGPATLRAVGLHIPETALWPSDVKTVAEALASIDVAYHMNHRNGPIGNYNFLPTGERSGEMNCTNPYPCEFDQGIIEGTMAKFAPAGALLIVKHDDARPCRRKGANSCTYLLSW